jgi:hypothetical protein
VLTGTQPPGRSADGLDEEPTPAYGSQERKAFIAGLTAATSSRMRLMTDLLWMRGKGRWRIADLLLSTLSCKEIHALKHDPRNPPLQPVGLPRTEPGIYPPRTDPVQKPVRFSPLPPPNQSKKQYLCSRLFYAMILLPQCREKQFQMVTIRRSPQSKD